MYDDVQYNQMTWWHLWYTHTHWYVTSLHDFVV